jgi:hypothetical protein
MGSFGSSLLIPGFRFPQHWLHYFQIMATEKILLFDCGQRFGALGCFVKKGFHFAGRLEYDNRFPRPSLAYENAWGTCRGANKESPAFRGYISLPT